MRKFIPNTLLVTLFVAMLTISLTSCRGDDIIPPSESIVVNPWQEISGDIHGFFLLNEGNMGSNKASLDYYDYGTGVYTRKIGRAHV